MNYLCNALQFSTSTELWISFFILIWFSCRNYLAIVSYHWKDHWGIIDIRESICAGGRASPEVYIWSARATTIPREWYSSATTIPPSATTMLQLSLWSATTLCVHVLQPSEYCNGTTTPRVAKCLVLQLFLEMLQQQQCNRTCVLPSPPSFCWTKVLHVTLPALFKIPSDTLYLLNSIGHFPLKFLQFSLATFLLNFFSFQLQVAHQYFQFSLWERSFESP